MLVSASLLLRKCLLLIECLDWTGSTRVKKRGENHSSITNKIGSSECLGAVSEIKAVRVVLRSRGVHISSWVRVGESTTYLRSAVCGLWSVVCCLWFMVDGDRLIKSSLEVDDLELSCLVLLDTHPRMT